MDPIGFNHEQLDSLNSLGRNPTQLDLIGSIGFSQIQVGSISSIALNWIQSDWVQGSGFRVQGSVDSGSRVQGSGFRLHGSVGSGFRVQGSGFDWVRGSGFSEFICMKLDSIGFNQLQLGSSYCIGFHWIQLNVPLDAVRFSWIYTVPLH